MQGYDCRSEELPLVLDEEPDISALSDHQEISDLKNQVRFSEDVERKRKPVSKSRRAAIHAGVKQQAD
jgi:hypothetical protein